MGGGEGDDGDDGDEEAAPEERARMSSPFMAAHAMASETMAPHCAFEAKPTGRSAAAAAAAAGRGEALLSKSAARNSLGGGTVD